MEAFKTTVTHQGRSYAVEGWCDPKFAAARDRFAKNFEEGLEIGACIACHGPEGKGNPAMGAPNLTDKTWLYGSGEPVIVETVTKGRTNQMPAHKDILSPAKIHLLTAYVLSLSGQK